MVCVCVRACVCVRVCVRACVPACVRVILFNLSHYAILYIQESTPQLVEEKLLGTVLSSHRMCCQ